MKKKILNYAFGAFIVLFFMSCGGDTPTSSSEKAKLTLSTGNPAIDDVSKQIANDPTNPALYAARAKAFYEYEGYDNAIQDMATAMKVDSTNLEYHHLLADIYMDYYKSRLALQTMKRCVGLHPRSIRSLLKLAEFEQILQQYDASMRTVTKIMEIDPQNAEAFFMLGVNHTLKGNKKMAIKNLQKAVEYDPDHADSWELLGNIFEEDKNPLAEQYYENAILASPNDVSAMYNKASYLHNVGKLEPAQELLRKIVVLDQQNVEAMDRLGVIYMEKDSMGKAYNHFDMAVKINPQFGIGYYHRALAAEGKGDFQAAKGDFEQVLKFDPEYERAKDGLARIAQALSSN